MRTFAITAASSPAAATAALQRSGAQAQYLAGGTTLLDLMKLDVMRPEVLVDLHRLHPPIEQAIEANAQGLRLSAHATMAEVARHPIVQRDYPVITQSLLQAASPQLREMATLGGNLLQRTRCPYFRDTGWTECNKREPGSGCAALAGANRQHAVLGTSMQCIATYAGDFAQALVALDADVETLSATGASRRLPLAHLHRLPGSTPQIETNLGLGELIVAIHVPAGPWTRCSRYLKIRDRASYQFALASAAVALEVQQSVVRQVRIALGGVATVPWRASTAERLLVGRPIDEALALEAAETAFAGAQPRRHNQFKIALGKQTLVRALLETAQSA